jgi:hypothetical protein
MYVEVRYNNYYADIGIDHNFMHHCFWQVIPRLYKSLHEQNNKHIFFQEEKQRAKRAKAMLCSIGMF